MSFKKPFNFLEHMDKLNSILTEMGKLADDYANPTGKGDHREELILEIFRSKLPPHYGVAKGEIIDSTGKRTREFDVIIYIKSSMPRYFSMADRIVIPCEDVVFVGEIKSNGNKEDIIRFVENIEIMNQLSRHFVPTEDFITINTIMGKKGHEGLSQPIFMNQNRLGIHGVPAFFFSYDSASKDTVLTYFDGSFAIPSNILGLYSLNKFVLIKQGGGFTPSPNLVDSKVLMMLIFTVLQYISTINYSGKVQGDQNKYMSWFFNQYDWLK